MLLYIKINLIKWGRNPLSVIALIENLPGSSCSISYLDYSPSYVYILIFLLTIFIQDMYINNMYFIILFHFKD